MSYEFGGFGDDDDVDLKQVEMKVHITVDGKRSRHVVILPVDEIDEKVIEALMKSMKRALTKMYIDNGENNASSE